MCSPWGVWRKAVAGHAAACVHMQLSAIIGMFVFHPRRSASARCGSVGHGRAACCQSSNTQLALDMGYMLTDATIYSERLQIEVWE